MNKLKSRKFWVCVAAMLTSLATSIAGLQTGNEVIATIGTVCGVVAAAIYAFCEAWVDQASVNLTGGIYEIEELEVDETQKKSED